MLTAEQLEQKRHGLGASEIAAVAGLTKRASPLDVWMTKDTASRPGVPRPEVVGGPMEVGQVLEPSLIKLYERRTGFHVKPGPTPTYSHPEHPWALATPDAEIVEDPTRLAEIKVVGRWMMSEWEDDPPPDYVQAQCQWQMFVTGRSTVDVAPLLGTEYPIFAVDRDEEICKLLFEVAEQFWFGHVIGDVPPPCGVNEERKDYLSKRFRGGSTEIVDVEPAKEMFAAIAVENLIKATEAVDKAEAEKAVFQNQLRELIADRGGIQGPWGKVTWLPRRGQPSYKTIAELLAPHGVIPERLIESNRGDASRVFRFTPPKKPKEKKGKGK